MKWYEKQKRVFQDSMRDADEQMKEVHTESLSNEEETSDIHVFEEQPMKQGLVHYEEFVNPVVEETPVEKEVFECTTIGKGTCMQGDIETRGDLYIQGSVYGNVSCGGKLVVEGEIEGNVKMESGSFVEASIKGDVFCSTQLLVEGGTSIIGDIHLQNLQANGQIKGMIHADSEIELKSHAVVEGDVEAQFLEIERGAILNGHFIVLAQKQ